VIAIFRVKKMGGGCGLILVGMPKSPYTSFSLKALDSNVHQNVGTSYNT
jgi:hypothetical protein